ncbi:MAG: glyceraldehyde 3-phosphate dehydrogenase NAD-binding domain-containing protein [Pseudomonadota bacterium]|nr:hypothetical protein [Gammaproteobacteria bacterium]MEC8010828.1 glyceraldehyde 3-phosphate dehydrogenase NAD-binding domain-containing protein [Pseudomonadota bacterium]|tara:strand:- start:93206 stop:94243 length:1038 start_codon:yes stop_codon:yes gene_type:complete
MKQLKVGINGCGRLGRAFLRQYLRMTNPQFQVVVINDPMPMDQLVYLTRYDSVHGRLENDVAFEVKGQVIASPHGDIAYPQTKDVPHWSDYQLDMVVELSGVYTKTSMVQKHLAAGAPKVLLGAPLLDEQGKITRQFPDWATGIWPGEALDLASNCKVFSGFSCTTQALVTLLRPLVDNNIGIESAMVTELHGFTTSQHLLDSPHKDWRRGRNAASSIIPTPTQGIFGAEQLMPVLQGRISGYSIRVPVPDVAALDVSVHLSSEHKLEQILALYKQAENGNLKNILSLEDQPLVSVDFIGRTESAVLAEDLCQVNRHQLRLYGWYDNEYGYARRLLDSLNLSVGQ